MGKFERNRKKNSLFALQCNINVLFHINSGIITGAISIVIVAFAIILMIIILIIIVIATISLRGISKTDITVI